MNLARMNKFATLAILPGMVLAIMLFSGVARDRQPAPEPPEAGVLVVANLRAQSLTMHNFRNGRSWSLALPGAPHEMAELNGRLYITLGRADLLVEVDPMIPAVLRTLRLPGEPHGIAVFEGNLQVTLDQRNAVLTVDPASLTVTRSQPTGDTPHMVATDGQHVFVTDTRDNRVRRLGEEGATAETGALPEGIAISGGYVVTSDFEGGTLSVFETPSLMLVRTIPVGAGPVRVVSLGDSEVAVSLQGPAELAIVDVARGAVTKRIEAPARPDGICSSPDGRHVAVAGNGTSAATIFEAETWRAAASVVAADGPGACLWLDRR
jgi:DNA-binding beta-propeller fold protein YncE